jgi:putative ABC transport system ATP-binding protein
MILIGVNEISKHYGTGEGRVDALRKVSFEINHGEFVAIVGPSGSGKSTLLSILGAMNPPSDGILEVDGIDVYRLSQERRADFRREYLGFVFQQLQLVPYLTALENVMLPLVVTDLKNHEERAIQVLEKMGLSGKLDRLPSELSGGEQSRVAIARALVNNPPIILADEPVGSLDTKTGSEVLSLFHELHKEGQTIVMVTHNPESLKNVGRVVQIKDGMIFSDSTSADLKIEQKIEPKSLIKETERKELKKDLEKLEDEIEELDPEVEKEGRQIAKSADFHRKLERELSELENEVEGLEEEKQVVSKDTKTGFREKLERELRELKGEVRELELKKGMKRIGDNGSKPASLNLKHRYLKKKVRHPDR